MNNAVLSRREPLLVQDLRKCGSSIKNNVRREIKVNLKLQMAKHNLIDINPKILKWAREESGLTITEMANDVGIDSATYIDLENSGKNVPFSNLKMIAKLLRRQIAIFFLPEVPKKLKKPKDYRNAKLFQSALSKETLLAIRRANRYSDLLSELNGRVFYEKKYTWLDEYHKTFLNGKIDDEEIAAWMRKKLRISLDQQLKVNSQSQAYKLWRDSIENELGIPVFQFEMPLNEIQGFSYLDQMPYSICVNSAHALTGRIFTVFHEVGHLLKQQSAICFPENLTQDQTLEFECNSFAGSLLIPVEAVIVVNSAEEILDKARKLKVSSEAYLRRLRMLSLLSENEFFALLHEIRSKVKPPGKPFGKPSSIQKIVNSRGQHLFDTIVDAARSNKISYTLASDVLGVRAYHLVSL
jgi:Zn-dependent peptidase ImmA (M78 family)/DNA-binding XRE family transcriptional regulator